MFEQACSIFQSNTPTKHLVLPYHHVILNQLIHYSGVSPHSWRRACKASHDKLRKYYEIKLNNDDSIIASFLNPKYHEGIFKQLGINTERSQHIIGQLSHECHAIMVQTGFTKEDSMIQPPSNNASYKESIDLIKHFNQTPLVTSYNVDNSQGD
ncbi:hypothetical protein O181_010712 [Austropuccinia psidii MF-1]|uniref:Uncharacterized protein n=1 Tax=Austropuccinia psidii MF-1 TaxID=1389203 RepID=A0A9Q3GLG4_9BASI|nr:hypothetical protein [Austropuccinia psidii MF-1]